MKDLKCHPIGRSPNDDNDDIKMREREREREREMKKPRKHCDKRAF